MALLDVIRPARTDPVRDLLRYLVASEVPRRVVLVPTGRDVPRCPGGTVAVTLPPEHLRMGLAAQLLALGVREVWLGSSAPAVVVPDAVAHHSGDLASLLESWRATLGDRVKATPARPRLWWRRPETLDLACVGVPRRALLGLPTRVRTPFSLGIDDADRTLDSLRLLRARGVIPAEIIPAFPTAQRATAATAPAGVATAPPTPASPALAPALARLAPTAPATRAAADAPEGCGVVGNGLQEAHPAARLRVQGCDTCGVCVRACSNGALSLAGAEGESVLVQDASACRGCLDCVSLCPRDALSAAGARTLGEVMAEPCLELARVATSECLRCHVQHSGPEGSLCEICAFRRTNPFGAVRPQTSLGGSARSLLSA